MARYRWLIGLFVIGLLVMVGGYAYQAGIAQGLAQSGNLAAPGAAAAAIMWRHPWGFGFFPFFPIFPIFFFILPSMLIVAAGPGILQIFKYLFPMMKTIG